MRTLQVINYTPSPQWGAYRCHLELHKHPSVQFVPLTLRAPVRYDKLDQTSFILRIAQEISPLFYSMPTCYLAERNACLCPVGSGWCMEGEDLAIDCSSGSHGTSVMWLQKGMCSGQLYLYLEWSEVHQFVQADFLCKSTTRRWWRYNRSL